MDPHFLFYFLKISGNFDHSAKISESLVVKYFLLLAKHLNPEKKDSLSAERSTF